MITNVLITLFLSILASSKLYDLIFIEATQVPEILNKKRLGPAKSLFIQLGELNARNMSSSIDKLTQFKFYTDLIKDLSLLQRQNGTDISTQLKFLKKNLAREIENDSKLSQLRSQSYLEMALISLFAWLFCLLSYLWLGISHDLLSIALCIGLQGAGFSVFHVSLKYLSKKKFVLIERVGSNLIYICAMLSSAISVSEIRNKLLSAHDIDDSSLRFFIEQISNEVHSLNIAGTYDPANVCDVMESFWNYYEEFFVQFRKLITVLKFAIILIFFVGSYFLLIFSLISSFAQGI